MIRPSARWIVRNPLAQSPPIVSCIAWWIRVGISCGLSSLIFSYNRSRLPHWFLDDRGSDPFDGWTGANHGFANIAPRSSARHAVETFEFTELVER